MEYERPQFRSDTMSADDLADAQKLLDYVWDNGGRAEYEAEVENEMALNLDRAVYGVRYTDVTGKRIDPRTVG